MLLLNKPSVYNGLNIAQKYYLPCDPRWLFEQDQVCINSNFGSITLK